MNNKMKKRWSSGFIFGNEAIETRRWHYPGGVVVATMEKKRRNERVVRVEWWEDECEPVPKPPPAIRDYNTYRVNFRGEKPSYLVVLCDQFIIDEGYYIFESKGELVAQAAVVDVLCVYRTHKRNDGKLN